jgi:hypothetical protein
MEFPLSFKCEMPGCDRESRGEVWGGVERCPDHNLIAVTVTQLNVCGEQRDAALHCLSRVMHTLAFSAASPADQRIYDEARALLAEHGRVGAPVEMVEAHREWEGRR